MKTKFTFTRSYLEGIQEMPPEIQSLALLSIIDAGLNGNFNSDNPIISGFLTAIKPELKKEQKIKTINNERFFQIQDFETYHKNYSGNKIYLLLAYRFWQLWKLEYPTYKTINDAQVEKWVNAIRQIVEIDKQKIDRLVAILKYFEKAQKEEVGFNDFWFRNLKSVTAFRKESSSGVYRLDIIAGVVNKKMQTDNGFYKIVEQALEKINSKK